MIYPVDSVIQPLNNWGLSDSQGLVEFAVRLVDSVFHLHERQVKFLGFKDFVKIQITEVHIHVL